MCWSTTTRRTPTCSRTPRHSSSPDTLTADGTDVEILEALCDGVCDSLLAIVYEKRSHPPEKVHQPWIDRQWEKVERSLDHLNANLPKTGAKLHAGHFALAAMLRYIELRFTGEWQKGRAKLKNWPAKFEKHFADYSKFKA